MPEKDYEALALRVDPSMRLPAPWTCGDCVNLARCQSLIGSITGHERHCDWAPHRFRLDTIGTLARLLDQAGATMTLYGEPISADDLRAFVRREAESRIVRALAKDRDRS